MYASVFKLELLAAFLSLFLIGSSYAGNPLHGARASGMGSTATAIADGPSAVSRNPAGLVQVNGTRIYVGATAVSLSSRFENGQDEEETENTIYFPPHAYLTHRLSRRFSAGIGIYSPYGIGGRTWDKNGLTRYVSTENTIGTINVHPVLAYRVFPWLSLGGGPFLLYAFQGAEYKTDQSFLGGEDGDYTFEGEGYGYGFTVGLLFFPEKLFRIGLTYRSGFRVDIEGEAELEGLALPLRPLFGGKGFKTDATIDVDFPRIISAGLSYRLSPRWLFGVDVDFVQWSSFDSLEADYEQEVPAAGFTDTDIIMDWNDAWNFNFGVEYSFSGFLALRAGYTFAQGQVPETTFSPAQPEADQHGFSLGFGLSWEKYALDVFYTLGLYEELDVENDLLSGEYDSTVHLIGASLGYTF